ncbi:TVP38/TMEM64 family protein [Clostridium scatologenes]|uniref:TVP38/TMEM64 family membrane protein n=1 Tax=Clostridium scatologenes TaxID=1548 RepID=A0A0E3JXJ1_CLOSL|nr:TVP38/TMEM64 family protein [Clostridium scatologenes]AKA68249.1 SNARE associated Golgi protein [Clostridium scatologenes]
MEYTKSLKNIKKYINVVVITMIIMLVIFVVKAYMEGNFSSQSAFENYIRQFGVFAPIALIVIQLLQVIFPVIPSILGSIVGVALFGSLKSFIFNYIGVTIGSIISFLLARKYGASFVKKIITEEKYEKYIGKFQGGKGYTIILVFTLLIPLAPDDILCYLSGLSKMSFKKFMWIIIFVKPWCILAYSYGFGALFTHIAG